MESKSTKKFQRVPFVKDATEKELINMLIITPSYLKIPKFRFLKNIKEVVVAMRRHDELTTESDVTDQFFPISCMKMSFC